MVEFQEQNALLLNHFNGYQWSSNSLQLRQLQQKNNDVNAITKADYEITGLFHKRTAPQHQIIITLNDLTLNIERF